MRNSHIDDFTKEELEILITKYFDCELSELEELLLNKIIAVTSLDSPMIMEYKAVVGFLTKVKNAPAAKRCPSFRRWMQISAAACVAVTLGIGSYHFRKHTDPSLTQCVAYVGNNVIEDKSTIMMIIDNDLSALREASSIVNDGMEKDLQSLSCAINDL